MITWEQLKEKFLDKGFSWYEFIILVPHPPLFDPSCYMLINSSREELLEIHKRNIQQVYGPEWDYWNTWIDYQKHK